MSPRTTIRALVVEDDPLTAGLVTAQVHASGFILAGPVVDNLDEAFREAERGDIDVIILDLHLTDAGALRVLNAIPTLAKLAAVIVLTADDDAALHDLCTRAGAYKMLVKTSYNRESLADAIRAATSARTPHAHAAMPTAPAPAPTLPESALSYTATSSDGARKSVILSLPPKLLALVLATAIITAMIVELIHRLLTDNTAK